MNKTNKLMSLRKILNLPFLLFAVFYWKTVGKKEFVFNLSFRGKNFYIHSDSFMDFVSIRETFVELEYDFPYTNNLPSTILDLGANIGDTAIFYAILFPNARIHAVEPNSHVFQKLLANTKQFPNILCHNCAVGNQTRLVDFSYSDSHFGGSIVYRRHNINVEKVQMYSLSDFSQKVGVNSLDVLKFDIEGAEEFILKDDFIKKHTRTIVGEIHDDLTTVPMGDLLDALELFKKQVKYIGKSRYIIFGNLHQE